MDVLRTLGELIGVSDWWNRHQQKAAVPFGCVVPELRDVEERMRIEGARQEEAWSQRMTLMMKENAQRRVEVKKLQSQLREVELLYEAELRQIAALKHALGEGPNVSEPLNELKYAEDSGETSTAREVDADVLLEQLRRPSHEKARRKEEREGSSASESA